MPIKKLVNWGLLLAISLTVAMVSAEIFVRVAANIWFDVKYLATAGIGNMPRAYASLEDFLGEFRAQLAPHRIWNNYYANSLGFTGRELSVAKPVGTRRIMALGDSFLYGMVAYPQNVLTLLEASLRRDCGDTEIMNFGMPATGVWEYRLVHKLAAPRYNPDVVVVHFYMGNDGPDLIFGANEVPSICGRIPAYSYAWNYVANSVKVLRSLNLTRTARAVATPAATDHMIQGGTRVRDQPDITDREFEPPFSEEAFAQIAAMELGRFYRGKNLPSRVDAWKPTLEVLDALTADVVSTTGRGPVIILYPSQLQVYPKLFRQTTREVEKRLETINPDDIDSAYPSQVLLEYCRRTRLSCYDVTPAMVDAARESTDPLYLPRDTHWNVRGNRVAAAAEATFLRHELCKR
ncbi:MAG: SGNH/GDSL hydrolase family protein [Xanthobacteraceae bacterium]